MMEDREHIWQLSAADTAKLREFLECPNGSWTSADWNVQVDACGAGVLVRTARYRYHSPLLARCVYCGEVGETQGEAATLEPVNSTGNFACKATDACYARHAGADPAYLLGRLLRQLRAEVPGTGRSELTYAARAELASLAVDTEDFLTAVRQRLGTSADDAVAAERTDRAERDGRLF